jgi:serine/threonine-protein phosphatase PP1 catalytic subunit
MVDNKKTDIDVDSIIEKLMSVRGNKPGKQVNLTE